MLCTKCGTRIPKGTCSCVICGTRLDSVTQTAPSVDTPGNINSEPVSIVEAALDAASLPKHYAPIVSIDASAAEPDAVPVTRSVSPVKKSKKKKALILLCSLILVVAAVIAVLSIPGKKTVYLVTEHVTENSAGAVTTYRYEYDSEGRIVRHEYHHAYPSSYFISRTRYEIAYTYDSKGNLDAAKLEFDGETITVDYLYEDGKLTGIESKDLMDASPYDQLNVSCDSEGRLTHIGFLDEDGNELTYLEFAYHDSGVLRQSVYYCKYFTAFTSSSLSSSLTAYEEHKNVTVYNQNGKTIENVIYRNGQQLTRNVYEYNSRGHMTARESYSAETLMNRLELDYSYDEGRLTGLIIRYQIMDDDEPLELQMAFDCEWDDRKCTLTVDQITCDAEMLKHFDYNDTDLQITFEIDDAGNVLNWAKYASGELQESHSYKYQALEVSNHYRKPDPQTDPMYLYFLLSQ